MNRFSLRALFRDYTTIVVLLALCALLAVRTLGKQYPSGVSGGRQLGDLIKQRGSPNDSVLIVVRDTKQDAKFAQALEESLKANGFRVVDTVRGQPADARRAIGKASEANERIDWIAGNEATTRWGVFDDLQASGAATKSAQVIAPPTYYGSTFLNRENLLNIPNQVAFIAIIAIGMTMVIIVGGIDLSVGSVVALSTVLIARAIRDFAGGANASTAGLIVCCLGGVLLCGAVGALNGAFVTLLRIPPFIVTLSTMSAAQLRISSTASAMRLHSRHSAVGNSAGSNWP